MTDQAGISILVADHDRWTRLALATMLDEAGFKVVQASNGVAALRIAQNVQPQIVLLRHNLPEIGALDVLATLKSDPRTRHCAVLQLRQSGNVDGELAADGSLDLPCDPIELLAAVIEALESRSATRISVARRQLEVGAPIPSVSASARGAWPLVVSSAIETL